MVATSNEYVAYIDTGVYYAKDVITGNTLSNASFGALLSSINTNLGAAGGNLYIRPGTYAMDVATTTISNPINFIGSGRGRTILQRTATAANPLLAFTASNLTVAQLTIDGNQAVTTNPNSELQFTGTNNLVRDVEIKNWAGSGGINNHKELTVRDCVITGDSTTMAAHKAQYGVLSFTDSTRTIIEGCNIQYCSYNAVFACGYTVIRDTYMANCAVSDRTGGFIGMLNPTVGQLNFCGVYGCTIMPGLGGDSGVEMANADFEVIGNWIYGINGAGVVTDPSTPVGPCIVANNIIKNCKGWGVLMSNNTHQNFVIRDNTIGDDQATPTQLYGIMVGHVGVPYTTVGADYYSITGNILYRNVRLPWLDLGTGTHKIIKDNIVL